MANWGHSNTPCMQSCEGTRLALGLQHCKRERFTPSSRHISGSSRCPVWPRCSKTPWPMCHHLLLSTFTNFSQVSRSTNNTSNAPTLIERLFISNQSPPAQEECNSWLALSQLKPVFSSKERQVMESRSEFMPPTPTPTVQHPMEHPNSIKVTCYEQHKPQR